MSYTKRYIEQLLEQGIDIFAEQHIDDSETEKYQQQIVQEQYETAKLESDNNDLNKE